MSDSYFCFFISEMWRVRVVAGWAIGMTILVAVTHSSLAVLLVTVLVVVLCCVWWGWRWACVMMGVSLVIYGAFVGYRYRVGQRPDVGYQSGYVSMMPLEITHQYAPTTYGALTSTGAVVRVYDRRQLVEVGDQVMVGGYIDTQTPLVVDDEVRRRMPKRYSDSSPFAFDYPRRRQLNGYGGSVTVTTARSVGSSATNIGEDLGLVGRARRWIRERFLSLYTPTDSAMLQGMILGDRYQFDDDTMEMFRTTGIAHMLVVSGGKLVIVIGLLHILLWWMPIYPKLLVILAILFFYAAIVGTGMSVMRSVIMVAIYYLTMLRGKHIPSYDILLYTVVLLLLWQPYALVYNVGMQLSVMAVAGIMGAVALWGMKQWRLSLLVPTLGATMGVLPVIIVAFGEIGLSMMLTNLLTGLIATGIMAFGIISLVVPFVFVRIVSWLIELFLLLVSQIYMITPVWIVEPHDVLPALLIWGLVLTLLITTTLLFHTHDDEQLV